MSKTKWMNCICYDGGGGGRKLWVGENCLGFVIISFLIIIWCFAQFECRLGAVSEWRTRWTLTSPPRCSSLTTSRGNRHSSSVCESYSYSIMTHPHEPVKRIATTWAKKSFKNFLQRKKFFSAVLPLRDSQKVFKEKIAIRCSKTSYGLYSFNFWKFFYVCF